MLTSTPATLELLEIARDLNSQTKDVIDSMIGDGQHKTARELAQALTNLLNSVARKLDAE